MEQSIRNFRGKRILERLFHEGVVLSVIVLNTIALILVGFPEINARIGHFLHAFDYACVVFYVLEVLAKVGLFGWGGYWKSYWNKFDFIIVLLGLPVLIDPFIEGQFKGAEVILLLRMGRFLRFFRMLRFIPNVTQIWNGILRSLKASVGIFIVLFILNLIAAMGANGLFGEYAPQHFGNPYLAFYSMFKVFTIEGWYEIPDEMAQHADITPGMIFLVRCYFAFSVIIGGVLGLSLANAVFVDEMTVDNTEKVEGMVKELREELVEYKKEIVELQIEHQKKLQELIERSG